jgi:SsrA-binding protein
MPTLAENRQARYDYEILETLEAGLKLTGPEVKSAKKGSLNLKGSFVTFHNNFALLTNAHIAPYKFAGEQPGYEPTQSRILLLHKKQLAYLRGKALEKGLTVIPLKVYTSEHLVKVELGVGRGKKQFNKKDSIKERDIYRDAKRTLKTDIR